MRVRFRIKSGTCGFETKGHASSEDGQHVHWEIESDCEKIRLLSRGIDEKGPLDAYEELSPTGESRLLAHCRAQLRGGCSGCLVPIGLFKSMQAAAGLALPTSSHIEISGE
ncbi:MAG: hypothetical protein HQL31_02180 [Planctomycetes bacterium]|nr:hypothetical protein [Planctomycetota bacterium]